MACIRTEPKINEAAWGKIRSRMAAAFQAIAADDEDWDFASGCAQASLASASVHCKVEHRSGDYVCRSASTACYSDCDTEYASDADSTEPSRADVDVWDAVRGRLSAAFRAVADDDDDEWDLPHVQELAPGADEPGSGGQALHDRLRRPDIHPAVWEELRRSLAEAFGPLEPEDFEDVCSEGWITPP